ncbi:MAG: diguanylate cyclase [Anaerovoracaceae bacterium]
MEEFRKILVVDDNVVNRYILMKILDSAYIVLEAENGEKALEIMEIEGDTIIAVMVDLVMPVMDGYQFMEEVQRREKFQNIPIIVTTGNNSVENEIRALKLGAWDFVTKPYNPEIIKFRLKNAIDRSKLRLLEQLKYIAEYDTLTGIYNKTKFLKETEYMLRANPLKQFAFVYFDLDRFQLINSFFGLEEGDRLLKYISNCVKDIMERYSPCRYGRMESDVFCCCKEYTKADFKLIAEEIKILLKEYSNEYEIVPNMGIYVIEDNNMSVEKIMSNAMIASKQTKGSYIDFFSYYTKELGAEAEREQEIIKEMNWALENDQFGIYIQPKYNITTNIPCGGEVLVRWFHPEKGIIMPGEFISIFEKNGFITKLDYYVWEKTCKLLKSWLDLDEEVYPLSVNISRVNMYNPNIAQIIMDLTEKYEIPPKYLQLEITESAYTDNPKAIIEILNKLKDYGFTILMDDFGTGYSSLNILKDLPVDILKVDMRFLSKTSIEGRGENILASVIRMAKWLTMPVVVEGAETVDQVVFLKSVGCDFVQGYYFAKPMPVEDYENLIRSQEVFDSYNMEKSSNDFDMDTIFQSNPQMKLFFGDLMKAMAIYEFDGETIEILRVNDGFFQLFGANDQALKMESIMEVISESSKQVVLDTFKHAIEMESTAECDYLRIKNDGSRIWIHIKLKLIQKIGKRNIIIGSLEDITAQKLVDIELNKYRQAITEEKDTNHMLVIDNIDSDVVQLKEMFKRQFEVFRAKDGTEAITILKENPSIGIILMDFSSPEIAGGEFLEQKKMMEEIAGIPVIVITSENSSISSHSRNLLEINDYITKPFIEEIVIKRVQNVMDSANLLKEVMKKYDTVSRLAETDQMTGLYNRITAEKIIKEKMWNNRNGKNAMIMIDIDNFKPINDTYGHSFGDKMLKNFGALLLRSFRKDDIIIRMGGDEFAVFMSNMASDDIAEKRAKLLMQELINKHSNEGVYITCSVGIAISPQHGDNFATLYGNADDALYDAKCQGKNNCKVFGKDITLEGK